MMQRLDKLVASQGTGSRSEARRCIWSGKVTVDGTVCRDPSAKVDPEQQTIAVAERCIRYQPYRYIMLNKPPGILCVSRDPKAKTVVDLVPEPLRKKGLFPAGRLDKDTVGLVLLTDDGAYAHVCFLPKSMLKNATMYWWTAPCCRSISTHSAEGQAFRTEPYAVQPGCACWKTANILWRKS